MLSFTQRAETETVRLGQISAKRPWTTAIMAKRHDVTCTSGGYPKTHVISTAMSVNPLKATALHLMYPCREHDNGHAVVYEQTFAKIHTVSRRTNGYDVYRPEGTSKKHGLLFADLTLRPRSRRQLC